MENDRTDSRVNYLISFFLNSKLTIWVRYSAATSNSSNTKTPIEYSTYAPTPSFSSDKKSTFYPESS